MSRQVVGKGARRPGSSTWALTVLTRAMRTHEDRSISLRPGFVWERKGGKDRKEAAQKPSRGRVDFALFSHLFLCFPHGK